MFVIDTNVLVYAANSACPEHAVCRGLLDHARKGSLPWYLTWSILYEFLRVTTHPRVLGKPWAIQEAWRFVAAVLASPNVAALTETDRHSAVAAQILNEVPAVRGNLLHDAHTAILMREHGIRRIYTRDADFHRFSFLEVIDPLGPRTTKTL
ncbi:MAG: PIN domain-containing protein [Acidobacteria bacterium]|nr:PIN domain-containing protein [Acidobacteriota bacterium]